MSAELLLYSGALIVVAWGVAHILPTRAVVAMFGNLSPDNRKLLTMEWVGEGLALVFIGALVGVVTLAQGPGNTAAHTVYIGSSLMLVVMAGWTQLTGARTRLIPVKLCPVVLSFAAILIIIATAL
jgi:hypothetical protein